MLLKNQLFEIKNFNIYKEGELFYVVSNDTLMRIEYPIDAYYIYYVMHDNHMKGKTSSVIEVDYIKEKSGVLSIVKVWKRSSPSITIEHYPALIKEVRDGYLILADNCVIGSHSSIGRIIDMPFISAMEVNIEEVVYLKVITFNKYKSYVIGFDLK